MHDGLAQTVSLLGMQVEDVIDLIGQNSDVQAVEELSHMRDVVEHISTDVRRSIASLQGAPQPRRSIQDLLAELPAQLPPGEDPQIELDFKVSEAIYLPLEQRAQAMLVIQEALLNAYRHSHAQRIRLILERSANVVSISIEDEGIGFDPSAWWENSLDHFGLGIIHARAARIGASLKIDSAPGQGTRVTLQLPLAPSFCNIQLDGMQEVSSQVVFLPGSQT